MHITCLECETIFNLEEQLLKSGGSKVRCSQCGNVFRAYPPEPETAPEPGFEPAQEEVFAKNQSAVAAVSGSDSDTDQELEGIDLAELDSIFEDGSAADETLNPLHGLQGDEDSVLDEDDLIKEGEDSELDLDFDMNLEPQATVEEVTTDDNLTEDLFDDLDLDMDFELDDSDKGEQLPTDQDLSLDDAEDIERTIPEGAKAEDEAEALNVLSPEDLTEEDFETALANIDLDAVEYDEPAGAVKDTSIEEAAPETGQAVKEPDLAFDELDIDLDAEEAPEPTESEELSLDDQQPAAVAPTSGLPVEEAELDSLELDDMEIGEITGESEQEPSQEEAPSEEESFLTETPVSDGVLDLALDDLNLEEDEKNLAADVLAEDVETSSDEEPELSLGAETSAAEAEVLHVGSEEQSGESNLTDEIDLTDLGSLLDESDDSARVGKQDELDIELSLDDGSPSKNADDEIELEALEFDLDAENDEKPASKTLKPEPVAEVEMEDEELDLSDIEQMLESDSILETDETESADKPEQLSNLEDELDLNEIEIAVNDSDGSAPEEKAEPEELDLELDLSLDDEEAEAGEVLDDLDFDLELDEEPQAVEAELAEPDRSPESREDDLLELDLEMDKDEEALNMSDLDTLVVDDHATNVQAKSDTIDTGDIELEFEVDEQAEEEDESGASQTFETSIDEISIDETGSEEFIEETLATATGTDSAIAASTKPYPMKKKKKKTRKFLVFLFILALLGVGGYYGFDYIMKNQIEIPYVSDFINEYLNPKPKDPVGINNLSVLDINSKFVESEQSGRLFIISGKVRNGYSSNRGMIQLQGKLFSKGKVLVMSETTYAGILISDQEFNTTPIAELKQRLNKMPTTRDTGTTVRPGQTLPFMLVFTDLPQDLDEFVIEKVRSQPVP